MSEGVGPWQDGQRAWERLAGWYPETPSAASRHRDDGDRALQALTDIGLARRLLDHVELEAVRTARRHGKSWTEIATRLGVTRQSAWERWRDVDDAEGSQPSWRESQGQVVLDVEAAAAAELAGQSTGGSSVSADVQAARERRRRSTVAVPNVIGMSWDDARMALHGKGLVGVGPDPDGPPLAALGWPEGVVTDQSPESGAQVPPGSPVTLWIERGGGPGVREPRRPKPDPKTGQKMREEATDEAS
jgi:hypothetical protein